MESIVTGTGDNFQTEVLEAEIPVVVDFWAPWCGPCRMLAPTVESIAEDLTGKLKVVKLNVDDNPSVATKYRVQSIPTLIMYVNGQPVNRLVGLMSKEKIMSRLRDHAPNL